MKRKLAITMAIASCLFMSGNVYAEDANQIALVDYVLMDQDDVKITLTGTTDDNSSWAVLNSPTAWMKETSH